MIASLGRVLPLVSTNILAKFYVSIVGGRAALINRGRVTGRRGGLLFRPWRETRPSYFVAWCSEPARRGGLKAYTAAEASGAHAVHTGAYMHPRTMHIHEASCIFTSGCSLGIRSTTLQRFRLSLSLSLSLSWLSSATKGTVYARPLDIPCFRIESRLSRNLEVVPSPACASRADFEFHRARAVEYLCRTATVSVNIELARVSTGTDLGWFRRRRKVGAPLVQCEPIEPNSNAEKFINDRTL